MIHIYRDANTYRLIIESEPHILKDISHFLATETWIKYPTQHGFFSKKIEKSLFNFQNESQGWIYPGLLEYLSPFLGKFRKKYPGVGINITLPVFTPLSLSNFWREKLRKDQQEDLENLLQFPSGIAAQYTGYGKTVCLITLAHLCTTYYQKRTLILSPTNPLLLDIQKRSEEDFQLSIPAYTWDNSLTIINPKVFFKTQNSSEARKWLQKVEIVLVDEVHNASSNSYKNLFNLMPNIQYSYGFSATPDGTKGRYLHPLRTTIKELGLRDATVIGLTGSIRVLKPPVSQVTLVKVIGEISPIDQQYLLSDPEEEKTEPWMTYLDNCVLSEKFPEILQKIFQKFPLTKFFIPIYKKSTGKYLLDRLINLGYTGSFWSSDGLYFQNENIKKKEKIIQRLKEEFQKDLQFLIATSSGFEGINIPQLNGVIPLMGVNHRLILQPAGRSSRGNHFIYVLIYDTNNPLTLSQAKKRRLEIEKFYTISHIENIKL